MTVARYVVVALKAQARSSPFGRMAASYFELGDVVRL